MLVGVNLLREGLDLPEVSLVAILDADKEGFLRSEDVADPDDRPGRPERQRRGHPLRRQGHRLDAAARSTRPTAGARLQLAYNAEHGITPETIVKGVSDIAEFLTLESPTVPSRRRRGKVEVEGMKQEEIERLIITLEEEMFTAAEELRFEYAAKLRDEIKDLRRELLAVTA